MKKTFVICIAIGAAALVYAIFYGQDGDSIAESVHDTFIISPEIAVGQNFIVGIDAPELDAPTVRFLTSIKPGGIILYKPNIKSPKQLKDLIDELQRLAIETSNKPYLIFIDEEPGGVTRLGLFKGVSTETEIDWSDIERDVRALRDIGINVELAPIADYSPESDSFISKRSVFRDSAELMDFNRKFISLLEEHRIASTLKHFPGVGSLKKDPHHGVLHVSDTPTASSRSMEIFKDGIDAGAHFVMTSHTIHDDIDAENSVTFSKKAIDILRGGLGFKGLIITDDISAMPLLLPGDPDESAVRAIEAGHTMVMFSWKRETTKRAWDEALAYYQGNENIRKLMDSNYALISAYKAEHLAR
jgi:beta-N-acetylhexosaminidase